MAKTPEIDLRENYGKNYFINGDMRIAQRGTSFPAAANAAYTLDRMQWAHGGTMVVTVSQDTDVPTQAQSGYVFRNSMKIDVTTADASIAASDFARFGQFIEGFNWANLAQKTFTLSFWVKATKTGTYCVSFRNTANDRCYVQEYTINASNTWEYKTITVSPSPSAGTWDYGTGIGLRLFWTLAAGTDFQTTAGAWNTTAAGLISTANQVNGMDSASNDFWITGVVLNEGYEALPFRLFGGDIQGEIAACQRYYEKSYQLSDPPGTVTDIDAWYQRTPSSTTAQLFFEFKITKRAAPTLVAYNPTTGASGSWRMAAANNAVSFISQGTKRFSAAVNAGNDDISKGHWTADAEL